MLSILGMSFSYSSIAILAVLVLCLIIGIFRGFMKSLFGMLAVILSIVATIFISPQLYPLFAKMTFFANLGTLGSNLATFTSTLVVSLGTYIILKVIFMFVRRALRGFHIVTVADRILGAIFNVVIGFFVISFVFYIITMFSSVPFFSSIVQDAAKDPIGKFFTENNVIELILNSLAKTSPAVQSFIDALNGAIPSPSAFVGQLSIV